MSPAEIAARLTPAQRKALDELREPGFRSLRPGHNLHAAIEIATDEGAPAFCDGRDLETLHRIGVAQAVEDDPLPVLGGPHHEAGDLDATHRWTLTPLGLAVRAVLEGEKGDG